jgi:gamma-glutamylcyclotransferase (GGCT)/AIG2-like uncharacterized protein YtfP
VNVVREGLRALDLDHAHVDLASHAQAPQVPPVFVYGTLRQGQSAHHILQAAGARPRGAATVRGRVGELRGHPALMLDPAAAPLAGELWEVPPGHYGPLDEYECFGGFGVAGSLYRRVVTWAEITGTSSRTLVWCYVHGYH